MRVPIIMDLAITTATTATYSSGESYSVTRMKQIEKLNNSIVPVAEGVVRVVILATLRIRLFAIKRQKLRCYTRSEELFSGPCVPKHKVHRTSQAHR